MPKNKLDQGEKTVPSITHTLKQNYAISIMLGNLNLLVGHPADRLKVAVQINPDKQLKTIIKPIIDDGLQNLYRSFPVSFYRQNAKIFYRTPIMSSTKWMDGYDFNIVFKSVLKGFYASAVDTLILSPLENIKTRQMKAVQRMPIWDASKTIYKERGAIGFFTGAPVTITKTCATWIYLFLGFEATKNKRDGFFTTLFWAVAAAAPISLITNPLDVLKSQRQATLIDKSQSSLQAARQLVNDFGVLILFRGFEYRLLHKALATLIGYLVLANNEKMPCGDNKPSTTNECKM